MIIFFHPCVFNQRLGWVRWFHAYWSFIWSWHNSFQWGSAGIPNTGESALLLCRTYAIVAYVRDNAVCRMPYEICRTGVRILSIMHERLKSVVVEWVLIYVFSKIKPKKNDFCDLFLIRKLKFKWKYLIWYINESF